MGLLRYNPAHRYSAKAALGHPWVQSRAGAIPRPLDASVGRGAANVAALRRLRTMVRPLRDVRDLFSAHDCVRRLYF